MFIWNIADEFILIFDTSGATPFATPLLLGMSAAAGISFTGFVLLTRYIAASPGITLRGAYKVVELVAGLTLGGLMLSISTGLIWLFGGVSFSAPSIRQGILFAFALALGSAVIEEIAFRGILLRVCDAWFGSWWALGISSAVFGAAHLTNPHVTVMDVIFITLEGGLVLGGAFLLTRRIWLAMGIHFMWNFAQGGLFSAPVSGLSANEGFFRATWNGPDWLTGGAAGLEGSVITLVVALLFAGGMLHLAYRHGMILPSVRTETRRERKRSLA